MFFPTSPNLPTVGGVVCIRHHHQPYTVALHSPDRTFRRREVMALWQTDGRYEWLEDKAERLRANDVIEVQTTLVRG